MEYPKKNIRIYSLLLIVVSLAFFLYMGKGLSTEEIFNGLFAVDLLQYWSTSKIFLLEQNVYNEELNLALQSSIWSSGNLTSPISLWCPPLVLSITFFLSFFSFSSAAFFWMFLNILLFSYIVIVLLKAITNSDKLSFSTILVLLTFSPAYFVIAIGQISFFLLLGFALFLYFSLYKRQGVESSFIGGLILSLTFIKPHLLYVVYIYILIRTFQTKKYNTIFGIACGILILSAYPLVYYPQVFIDYLEAISAPPIYWKTPTIGSYLQDYLGIQTKLIRLLPTIVVGLLSLWILSKEKYKDNKILFYLVPLSLITSPYGWTFDQVLLLPSIFYFISVINKKSLAMFLLIAANLMTFIGFYLVSFDLLIWYPALIILLMVNNGDRDHCHHLK